MNATAKYLCLAFAVACLWGGVRVSPAAAEPTPAPARQVPRERPSRPALPMVGKPAPPFNLDGVLAGEFRNYRLADYRGKWVVLFFYPLDFTFVCPTEIKGFNNAAGEFEKLNAVVFGVSVDSTWAHKAWIERGDLGDLKYPLLSDIRKEAARNYGVLDERSGVALRGLFIIDDKGVLQFQSVNNLSVGRSTEETLRMLEALQTGELCPVNWKPGQKTLGK